jgi:type I restriction enzyme S subunit
MIDGLKPYPRMKDSGVPWLGKVPEHWLVLPNRAVFTEVKDRGHPEAEMLSVTITRGVIRQQALLEDSAKKDSSNLDKSAYKLVRPGDIAYNKMRAWQGAIGVSEYEGIVSPAYVVQRPREAAFPHYLHYLFRTPGFAKEAERWSYGITSDMWSLRPEHFKMIYSCLPPREEQTAIVRFLDHVDRRIRRYIRAKQKQIKLLEELKAAIIHRAVTRGLDPNVRLKPSGVKWLGDVPAHWEVMPLRRASISRCDGPFGSGLKSGHYTDHGIRVVRLQNIGHAEFRNSDAAYISPAHYSTLGDHDVESGDLLVAGLGDERHPAGRACVAPSFIVPAMVKADCFRFRLCRERLDPEFAALHLTATAVGASSILSTGATRQRTNLQATASRAVVVPPLPEQFAIVQDIASRTASLLQGIRVAEREISLLREYRTRLIADVVTGKLDVREAAARLPDEAEEPEPLDEAAVEDEAEPGDTDEVPEETEA